MNAPRPPRWADRFLVLFCAPHRHEEVLGDLHEEFAWQVQRIGERRARWRYWRDVLGFAKPFAIKRKPAIDNQSSNYLLSPDMIRNYLKLAGRNLVRNKVYSALNIAGLSVGMAVAMLIGLWMWDELSYNTSFANHDRIVQVLYRVTEGNQGATGTALPIPLGTQLRNEFGSDFKHLILSSWTEEHILATGDRKFTKTGNYMQPGATDMLSLNMVKGTRNGLNDPNAIMLSETTAESLFGTADPIGKTIKYDNKSNVQVTGVYQDFPFNSAFKDVTYIAPWDFYLSSQQWTQRAKDNWHENSFQLFAQLNPHVDPAIVSAKISGMLYQHTKAPWKPELFLHPMDRWYLYSGFLEGSSSGDQHQSPGRIQFVWMFGFIGLFVLLLACINFMNLSTARSEKRAKEVGIRKAVGSVKSQLIGQFLSESFLMVILSFGLTISLVFLVLPLFNELADKQMVMPWTNPIFWSMSLGFIALTGLIAGSYPAFYLSSFEPIKALKGTGSALAYRSSRFSMGRLAVLPRKVLVVTQFTVSVTLIIGTLMVFRQIQFAKNRPIGYSRDGLMTIRMNTPDLFGHYGALRSELIGTGAVENMAESSSATYSLNHSNSNFTWKGKTPDQNPDFGTLACTADFGKTIGWQIKEGRDFSERFSTDTSAMIIDEATAQFLAFKHPLGQQIKWGWKTYTIIGVVKNMVMQSPFESARSTVYFMDYEWANMVTVKLKPDYDTHQALAKVESVFRKYNPGSPFDFKFNDQEYERKFRSEERIGQLAGLFAGLAILISCLGIFGLASFMAEQRTKEIGVRKVLGASVLNLWGLLSKDFVVLVGVAFLIAVPITWYLMSNWLHQYAYRTEISWWIFAASGAGALVITLLTVSFQSIRAALMNPVKSLRSE